MSTTATAAAAPPCTVGAALAATYQAALDQLDAHKPARGVPLPPADQLRQLLDAQEQARELAMRAQLDLAEHQAWHNCPPTRLAGEGATQ